MNSFTRYITLAFLVISTLFATADFATAKNSDWQGIDKAQVRLVSAQTAIGNTKDVALGLQFEMEKNWKVYWRSPGDAGFPPDLDWSASNNVEAVQMDWPVPKRFEVLGLETVGYKDAVLFPLTVRVKDPAQKLDLKMQVRFLTCDEVCIPVDVNLSLSLDSGVAASSDHAQLISRAVSKVPTRDTSYGSELVSATLYEQVDGKSGTLRVHLKNPQGFSLPDGLMEGPEEFAFFRPAVQVGRDGQSVLFDFPMDGLQFLKGSYKDHPFVLTVMDGPQAFELSTQVRGEKGNLPYVDGFATLGQAGHGTETTENLLVILALAVLGGLILNLMPCVLPVLSLKVLGLVSHGGGAQGQVRQSFLASSAGILVSFWALAVFLITLKLAGGSIGWGIQFQQPLFLIALMAMIVLFAANMWGLFEINLPGWMSSVGASGQQAKGLGGHFLTGAFATLLATPCSAPFLGTAVGFALSRGPVDIMLVFTALGLGLALPYILIALFPALATKLPKPGNWMITLRKILGLLLLGTAGWLLSVLAVQVSVEAAIVLAGLMVLVIVILFMREKVGRLIWGAVSALFIIAFLVPGFLQSEQVDQASADKIWVKFSPQKIAQSVAQGQVVFVDVTAQWCITCQVNKKLVVYDDEVFDQLSAKGVTAMKADWTNPDPVIADYLASFQKYAIPFNVVYGPAAPQGIVLPELLTKKAVLDALLDAKG